MTLGLLASLVILGQSENTLVRAPASDDALACAGCHAEASSYAHTRHEFTSSIASTAELSAIFASAGGKLTITTTPLPTLAFLMEEKNGRFTETATSGWGDDLARTSEPVDVVIGSGKRGQTYLYWSGNQLYELPVSFWRENHRWINSPGYIDGTADFRRPVQAGCLECHATAITPLAGFVTANGFDRKSFVPGIECSTCHGSGTTHVALEKKAVSTHTRPTDSNILNPTRFARPAQLDLCGLCHSGIQRIALKPAFSYMPGEPLTRYFQALPGADKDRPDVHGNQVGMLERSRCFQNSTEMTCSTCHNVHTSGEPVETYAKRCMTCHTWQNCGESRRLGEAIKGKCIGCHMPLEQTNSIVSTTAGREVQATMRTHWIKIYPGTK